jgi:hypothetical protein
MELTSMTSDDQPAVRQMHLSEVDIRINYFYDACEEHLRMLRVDRTLLPTRQTWHRFCAALIQTPRSAERCHAPGEDGGSCSQVGIRPHRLQSG